MTCPVMPLSKKNHGSQSSSQEVLRIESKKVQDYFSKWKYVYSVNLKLEHQTITKVDGHFCCPCGESRNKFAKNLQKHARNCSFDCKSTMFLM